MHGDPVVNPESFFCPYCQGTGRANDADDECIGLSVRSIRRRHEIAAADVAEVMGVSRQYVCDLELGRRPFSLELVKRYKRSVGAILEVRSA